MLVSLNQIAAQCNPPGSIWLVPPVASSSLVVKWASVPGATQYQLHYWEKANPADKTIVENCGPAPFTLRGLRKNTQYTLEIRAKCGTGVSAWSAQIGATTLNSSGSCNNAVTGVTITTNANAIQLGWTSTGGHTIRYRSGSTGDWLVPTGAINLQSPPYTITGLNPGNYELQIKRNCSGTSGLYQHYTATIANPCTSPLAPVVSPAVTSAFVELPANIGVLHYNIEMRTGTSGPWTNAGNNIPPSTAVLDNLSPSTLYQIQIQAVCILGVSDFSPIGEFTTGTAPNVSCLSNKNAGKNLDADAILMVNQKLNHPSPYTFGSMIGVNDGGLVFRSFQTESFNQISLLTKQIRNFHTMDEDFDASLQSYALNIKPKDTNPEGTPGNIGYNQSLYALYRQVHGFDNFTAATELLQYSPQSWKEKIYQESDWSVSGPAGIRSSYRNYTEAFIQAFAPINGSYAQMLAANYQVGNEPWDYPVKEDYHSLLLGAHDAFLNKYGPKSAGKWRMNLVAGAFQSFRDNNCFSMLRDFSNCGGGLERHDFIGDFLDVANCQLLQDLDAIDCHPYSFKPGSTHWTHPEDPSSEFWQIRNQAAWLMANQDQSTGVLRDTRLWCTEFGFDSYAVGEKTQNAYLLRGLLLHSRYHFEKLFFYNAFDVVRENYPYYDGFYNSSGFWKLGTHPENSAWTSPLEAHGAKPKPSWFGMLDMKSRFGEHVFHKVLHEDEDAFVILIAKPDSTEPYLVYWSPRMTNDANIHQDIPVMKNIQWGNALTAGYMASSTLAQSFAETNSPGSSFESLSENACGSLIINTIRRAPSFVKLESCNACPNVTNPGSIVAPTPSMGVAPFNPGAIFSSAEASGGSGGTIEYQWQQSLDNNQFVNITGATGLSYNPQSINETTYFRRLAKRSTCATYIHSTPVALVVGSICPTISTFVRQEHAMSGCNPGGDYYYEVDLSGVTMNEQITLSGLPGNGINIPLCLLNETPLTPATFQSNIHYVSNTSFEWQVMASNGANQSLRLYYCWAESYPNPVSLTTAKSLCSGLILPCMEAPNVTDPGGEGRGLIVGKGASASLGFLLAPNPGSTAVTLQNTGPAITQASVRFLTATGQVMLQQNIAELLENQTIPINTSQLPAGLYFVCLQTGQEVKWMAWERL